jgi:L-threonylcarbamoyladenylate synthase
MIENANETTIEKAARILLAGGLVAFPTETVYGLGADATSGRAVARIFEAKGRPRFNPLIVHVPNFAAARDLAEFGDGALALARRCWPGPLTLVLPLSPGKQIISELATAGLDTIAIRVPAHPIAQHLLQTVGRPIAAPSANISGRVSPTQAGHVADDLGDRVEMILDGGDTEAGIESTIITLSPEPVLLRSGAFPREDIEAILDCRLGTFVDMKIISPGQLTRHYAPRAALRLDAADVSSGESLLGFGPNAPEGALNLSRTGDLREAAANLFAHLRTLDAERPEGIAVMPIPQTGLGEAINDRLRRGAYKKRGD